MSARVGPREATLEDAQRVVRAARTDPVRFTITGMAPRTKKNSQRIMRKKDGTPFVAPSQQATTWAKQVYLVPRPARLPDRPWNCKALIYRDANRGDAVGYYQAVADLLEKLGVVSNDRWIVSWDGSRMLKDAARPRIEVELTEVRA